MLEIRAEGLRFSESETEDLLNNVLRLGLDADAVRLLHERTEGWAAGLYLAALSLQGRTDPREFIEAFAGDDRHIVDYLGSEVLQGQPETVRDFLIRTSILHRLSGAVCDAVTDTTGSTRMLEEIERSNHFLISLDDKRQWYRYHHLFAELLLHELQRTEAHLIPVLHSRASAWHEQQGFIAESIHHAVAAGETRRASALIAAHWNTYFNQGRLETVASWLDALPPKVVAGDTRLCLARVWLAMDLGRLDEAETWIGDAEQAIAQTSVGEGAESLEVDTGLVRALHHYKVGDIARSIQDVRELERKQDVSVFARTVMSCIQGVTTFWAGETADAEAALKEAVRLARIDGNALATVYALGYLAAIRAEQGELLEADPLVAEATTLSREPTVAEHFVTMMVHLARGRVSEQRGELTNALPAMERAVELSRRGAGRTELAYALLSLARLRHSQGDLEGARELLNRARGIADRCPDPGVLEAMLVRVERAARRIPARAGPRPYVDQELSDRELAILRLLPSELSQRDIGAALYISLNTVKTHTRGIFRKLDASNRQEAVARARDRGLL
jgi:LuxR family maltose regulon positive regulatory protein